MGATIQVLWPGLTESDSADQPAFGQDSRAYAAFMTDVVSSFWLKLQFQLRGLSPLLSFHHVSQREDAIAWTTPAALKQAARKLRDHLLDGTNFSYTLTDYYRNGPGVEPRHLELANDLTDVMAVADYAAMRGASKLTLTVDW